MQWTVASPLCNDSTVIYCSSLTRMPVPQMVCMIRYRRSFCLAFAVSSRRRYSARVSSFSCGQKMVLCCLLPCVTEWAEQAGARLQAVLRSTPWSLLFPIFADADEEQLTVEVFSIPDQTEELISLIDTLNFLDALKNEYTGVVRRGIEALEWKVKGLSGAEIADIYGVKPNLVGAWISKAVRKLEKNRMFIIWRDNLVVENKLT